MSKKTLFHFFFTFMVLVAIFPLQGEDFTQVAEKAIPAVVSVQVEMQRTNSPNFFSTPFGQEEDPFGDEFFRRFFNIPKKEQRSSPSIGQGSGFIVSKDGYILTNNHIVENAEKIKVKLNNGREYEGQVIGRDTNTDVAVIKIEGEEFPFLQLGNSSDLKVGQWVVAIGNPLGFQATLTAGVVSAVGRNNIGLTQIEDFIQTDAAINRGNSGGPLLNLQGEVIGMNTAIATNTGGYMGIGFAIPSNIAAHIMDQLIHNGSFTRGYLGVMLQQVDQDLADAFDLNDVEGALVAEVESGSPAEQAGLKRGDVIISYNNKPVHNISEVRNGVSMMKPDETVKLLVKRGNSNIRLKVKVGNHPSNSQTDPAAVNKLGLKVSELTPEMVKNLEYVDEKGVVVTTVEPGSIGSLAGIKKGALIIAVNHKDVTSPDEFDRAVSTTEEGKPILLLIKQGKLTHYLSLKIN